MKHATDPSQPPPAPSPRLSLDPAACPAPGERGGVVSLRARYSSLVAAGGIERDGAQEAVVARLARLNDRLAARPPGRRPPLGWLFRRRETADPAVRGLYLWGDVGRGKTMLMDLFFATCPVRRKRRVHFHAFMLDVHERLQGWRERLRSGAEAADPVMHAADDLADEAQVLCFDEFNVTDIADAMILGRLFTRLFERGVVVVATSNVAPADLYRGGLNRALFVPFIDLLAQRLDVVRLAARTDFRLEKLGGIAVWHVPADAAATRALDDAFAAITAGERPAAVDLTVKGHRLHVPCAANGAARFGFPDLCSVPLGPADYLRIADHFHTVVIDRVPVMTAASRNEAKRFIALVDALYDGGVKLLASAAARPPDLYQGSEGFEASEFRRTASRLIEMGSRGYLALPHGRPRPATLAG